MKNELSATTSAATTVNPLNPPARRRVRRQLDSSNPIKHLPSTLLGHEQSVSFHFVREAVSHEFTPQSNYQQILSEYASQNLWRTFRASALEAAASDIQVADQAQHVDRTYEEIDDNCRLALTFRDPLNTHIRRHILRDESEYTRRHFFTVKR
ncbi:MAG: hypothetical protein Q7U75_04790, partial [Desulfobacterales bacterium]|nr:hypothetical protein [Desulfobacterales bacterium]